MICTDVGAQLPRLFTATTKTAENALRYALHTAQHSDGQSLHNVTGGAPTRRLRRGAMLGDLLDDERIQSTWTRKSCLVEVSAMVGIGSQTSSVCISL